MKFPKNLTKEFKAELFKAIRLSVFLTALVLGFLVLQNRVSTPEEVVSSASKRAMKSGKIAKCAVDRKGNRVPASQASEVDSLVECD